MPSTSKHLVEALDFITADQTPAAAAESLHAIQVTRVRCAFDDPNIVGVGISRKVTDGKELEDLCVCFYVVDKQAARKIAPKYFVPPVIATNSGEAAYTDVKAIGRIASASKLCLSLLTKKRAPSVLSLGSNNERQKEPAFLPSPLSIKEREQTVKVPHLMRQSKPFQLG